MERTGSSRGNPADALYDAARACPDAALRGVLLALATHQEGVALAKAARIWGVDPATLRHALRRVEEDGLDGLFGHWAPAPPSASPRRDP